MKTFIYLALAVLLFSCNQDEIVRDSANGAEPTNIQTRATIRNQSVVRILSTVPHYHEWDASENPRHYNWCAHAALKMVGAYHGTYHTLNEIHGYFLNNSNAYARDRMGDGKFSGSLYDILIAARDNYGFRNTHDHGETIHNIDQFFQRLKDGVDYKKPAIVPSTYNEPYGHMYPVVGYAAEFDQNGKVDYSKALLYLRDSKLEEPFYQDYDLVVNVRTFYNSRASRDILIIKP